MPWNALSVQMLNGRWLGSARVPLAMRAPRPANASKRSPCMMGREGRAGKPAATAECCGRRFFHSGREVQTPRCRLRSIEPVGRARHGICALVAVRTSDNAAELLEECRAADEWARTTHPPRELNFRAIRITLIHHEFAGRCIGNAP
jgi:hypothetical protein